MNNPETIQGVFISVASKFSADRDDAISKINRALDCNDPNIDIEKIVYENIGKLAHAKMCLQTINEELSLSLNSMQKAEKTLSSVPKTNGE